MPVWKRPSITIQRGKKGKIKTFKKLKKPVCHTRSLFARTSECLALLQLQMLPEDAGVVQTQKRYKRIRTNERQSSKHVICFQLSRFIRISFGIMMHTAYQKNLPIA